MLNMSKAFVIDGDDTMSYSDLLSSASSARHYFRTIKTGSLCAFALNTISALAHGKDIVLADSDLSEDEQTALGIDDANVKYPLENAADISSFEELVAALKNSPSQITIFTSGTSGLPKKVVHTVESLTRAVRCTLPDFVWGFAYNPTHIAGLQVMFQFFLNANTAVNLFGKSKSEIYYAIDSFKITHISATPTFYRLLFPEEHTHDSVVRLTCGGEKSGKSLYDALQKVFPNAKINNIYASTEFGTLLVSNGENFKIPENLASVVKIENSQLCVHKNLVGASDSLQLDGDFYKTGDIVEIVDAESGSFKFLARASNMINVGGYKVNLEEVEDALRAFAEISDASAFGKPNSVLGNILCVDIKLAPDADINAAQIRFRLEKKLQPYKIPRLINFVETLRLTRTGKAQR